MLVNFIGICIAIDYIAVTVTVMVEKVLKKINKLDKVGYICQNWVKEWSCFCM